MATLRRHIPTWLVLLFGVLVGVTFTTTLTFHLQWCAAISAGGDRPVRMPVMALPLTQHHPREEQRCVCGEELDALERQETALLEAQTELAGLRKRLGADSNPAPVLDSNQAPLEGDLGVSVDAGELVQRRHVSAKTPTSDLHRNEPSKPSKEGLVVGVVARQANPEWVESVHDTWGRDAGQLLIFVGDDFNHSHPSARGLPLVRLPGAHADAGVKGANMILSAFLYLSKHYLSTHRWFMLTVDNSYVRIDRLQELLSQLSPLELLYLGRAATGRKDQADKLGLKLHERYCLGSSGVVLSSALLSQVKGQLAGCMGGAGVPEDVELGKCISANAGIQCTQSDTVRTCTS